MEREKVDVEELLAKAKSFFKDFLYEKHINKGLDKASRLESYNYNPFLIEYLANFLEGDDSPQSIAKALLYPRILGTSISTSFGSNVQKMINEVFEGFGSTTSGIDIEFIDFEDGRKKYCQVKSGPQTINKDDVTTIINHFKGIKELARTNNLDVRIGDLIVGVLYGHENDLNSHYKKLNTEFNIYVGKNFWYRLTGYDDFYENLIKICGEIAFEVDARAQLDEALRRLTNDVKEKFPT